MAALLYGAVAGWCLAGIMWWIAFYRGKRLGFALGLGAELAGALLWLTALTFYGLKAGYWPMSTPGEFLLLTLGFAVLIHAAAEVKARIRGAGWITPVASALLALWARDTLTSAPFPPPPALNSIWFQLHTLTASAAYGAFLAAGATSLGAILKPEQDPPGLAGEMALGYTALTLSMLTGALWGQFTWGSYWSWSLKEIWTLTLWLAATLYFHIRTLPRWRGRRTWLVVTLLAGIMFFSLMGTGWLARKLTLETLYIF